MALQKQFRLRDEVIKIYDEYDKGKISREPAKLKEFLERLNETWEKFDQGHDELMEEPGVDFTTEYFTNNQHGP